MLKKQTVWLLTMLSLMIVLSVYYLTSDKEDLAYIDSGETELEEPATTDQAVDNDVEINGAMNNGQDELFTTIRMELQNERSMKKDRLKDIVASNNATTEEKNDALNDINTIDKLSTKESILQDSILAMTENYQDVLVRTEEDKVHVHVKVDDLSVEEANNIMQMVRDELGEITVDVNFQSTEG